LRQAKEYIDPAYATYLFSGAVPHAHRIQVMKYRHGSLWNRKIADRMRPHLQRTTTQQARHPGLPGVMHPCPICGREDSGGHILGACAHPHLQGQYILRHNKAVQIVAKALRASTALGTEGQLWMDAGHPDAGIDSIGTRLPPWMLPHLPTDTVAKLRPDILYIQGLPADMRSNPGPLDNKTGFTIHIVEVGYGPDTRYVDKRKEKEQQHQKLVAELRAAGWAVAEPHIIILGSGATIYKSTTSFLKNTLQLSKAKIRDTIHRLIRHAAQAAYTIVSTRRHLEFSHPQRGPGRGIAGSQPLKRRRDPGG
jgi:hypothetical protein